MWTRRGKSCSLVKYEDYKVDEWTINSSLKCEIYLTWNTCEKKKKKKQNTGVNYSDQLRKSVQADTE